MLYNLIEDKIDCDEYGKSTVSNIYLDTPDFLLIRNSIDAKSYKEKLRIRSYGVPNDDSKVFFEIKKKYKGIVYKRRLSLTCNQVTDYIENGNRPTDSQIMREIDWCMKIYENPKPKVVLSYEREAFYWKNDKDIRLTFDRNVRYRMNDLSLQKGSSGVRIIPEDSILMEIKTPGSMPIELAEILSLCKIYPSSFSKYGKAYMHYINNIEKKNDKGDIVYV